MKGGKRPLGYTIIEVMIVLAISGVLFVIAAVFISGKQAKTAFTEGSNEFTSELQAVIAQVSNGQYSDVDIKCSASPGSIPTFNSSGGTRGKNASCVFIAKLLTFTIDSPNYTTYPLATSLKAVGAQQSNFTTPVIGGGIDLTSANVIAQQLQVKSIKVTTASTPTPTSIALAGKATLGFAQTSPAQNADGTYVSGSQSVYLVTAAAEPTSGSATALQSAETAVICLTDGTRYAQINLGSANNSNRLSADLQVAITC